MPQMSGMLQQLPLCTVQPACLDIAAPFLGKMTLASQQQSLLYNSLVKDFGSNPVEC